MTSGISRGVERRDTRKLEEACCCVVLDVVVLGSTRLVVRAASVEQNKDVEGCKESCTRTWSPPNEAAEQRDDW